MTDKQKLFCDNYLINFNATKSAISAGYSEKTAYSIGEENLKKPEIKQYIADRMKEKTDKLIASQNEILENLTGMVRNKDTRDTDKLRAIELLMKYYDMLNGEKQDNTKTVRIINDIPIS